jgi:pilus assembly protein FimV
MIRKVLMHRLFNLCLWQVIFAGLLLSSTPNLSAQEAGISLRGPKSTDVYPYRRYGPINSSDTLWKIATKIRPNNDVSHYQIMQAIFEKNPQAFANNNINHLVNGQYITIPTLADILVIDDKVARAKTEKDTQAWTGSEKVVAAKEKKVVEKTASQKDLQQAKVEINEQLQSIETEQKGRLETIQRDVLDSIDGLQAILKENESLKQRLGDFNEQLTEMQETGVVKDEEVKQDMDNMLELQRKLKSKKDSLS